MKYSGKYTQEISFPLGGIGTGSIGLDGAGRLVDFEIFNRPDKGSINGYSHFAIKALGEGEPITYILNGDMQKELVGRYRQTRYRGFGYGPESETMCGFPHFRQVTFDGELPIATLDFADEKFPANVKMTAFNPMIPNDAYNSSLPAAFFEIAVENTDAVPRTYQIALSVANPFPVSRNRITEGGALMLYRADKGQDEIGYGDLTVATDAKTAYIQEYWYRGKWQDGVVSYWNDFHTVAPLRERHYATDGSFDTGTVVAELTVAPRAVERARFVLAWNIPNNYNYWNPMKDAAGKDISWKNYYATVFRDSAEVAAYALANYDTLFARTRRFAKALYGSTLPSEMVEAAAANLSVLKSPTVWRLSDGSFYGWEGVHEKEGSCEGTCQHVWNYAYALSFLFPALERSIRELEFKYSTVPSGKMSFRLQLPLGREPAAKRACVDGQMGAVIKCYREWKLSGDDAWLRSNWERIQHVLAYAWSAENPDGWDRDKDGVLEGRQHHTLDMELFGPSSWLEGMYLAALKAASEMADYLGEKERAGEYAALFEKGYRWTRENLFNGKYFFHKVDLTDRALIERYDATETYWNAETGEIKYQVGEGSALDQLLAQWHAALCGLGDIFDPAQVSVALDEMMENNFKTRIGDFVNPWRIFSLGDEAGAVICDYPTGAKKPKIPVPYCEETMTGFEYAFAGLLCAYGKVDAGRRVVAAIRDRYDGKKRNPWSEIECGSNYARSMASFALLPILSGFSFDLPRGYIGFAPYQTEDFSCLFSVEGAWGTVFVTREKMIVYLIEGALDLTAFGTPFDGISAVLVDGEEIAFSFSGGKAVFAKQHITKQLELKK